jgi:acyl carrier protein
MNKHHVIDHLKKILREVRQQAPHHALTLDAEFIDTLGMDSLDLANFVTEVECTFRVLLSPEALKTFNTLNKLGELIQGGALERSEPGAFG